MADGDSDSAARLTELEVKVAFLERHTQEQDRVILDLSRRLDLMASEQRALLKRFGEDGSDDPSAAEGAGEGLGLDDGQPPHY